MNHPFKNIYDIQHGRGYLLFPVRNGKWIALFGNRIMRTSRFGFRSFQY